MANRVALYNGFLQGIQGAKELMSIYDGVMDRRDKREAEAYQRGFNERKWAHEVMDSNRRFDLEVTKHKDTMDYHNRSLAETSRHNKASEGISRGLLGVAWANHSLSAKRLAFEQDKVRRAELKEEQARKRRSDVFNMLYGAGKAATDAFPQLNTTAADGAPSSITEDEFNEATGSQYSVSKHGTAVANVLAKEKGINANEVAKSMGLPEGGTLFLGHNNKTGQVATIYAGKDADGKVYMKEVDHHSPEEFHDIVKTSPLFGGKAPEKNKADAKPNALGSLASLAGGLADTAALKAAPGAAVERDTVKAAPYAAYGEDIATDKAIADRGLKKRERDAKARLASAQGLQTEWRNMDDAVIPQGDYGDQDSERKAKSDLAAIAKERSTSDADIEQQYIDKFNSNAEQATSRERLAKQQRAEQVQVRADNAKRAEALAEAARNAETDEEYKLYTAAYQAAVRNPDLKYNNLNELLEYDDKQAKVSDASFKGQLKGVEQQLLAASKEGAPATESELSSFRDNLAKRNKRGGKDNTRFDDRIEEFATQATGYMQEMYGKDNALGKADRTDYTFQSQLDKAAKIYANNSDIASVPAAIYFAQRHNGSSYLDDGEVLKVNDAINSAMEQGVPPAVLARAVSRLTMNANADISKDLDTYIIRELKGAK
ncbi:hypothetical protein HPC37_02795 [Pasteurellaceae bacterium 20609_3]|uniref:hypothetical protein n=1 Tax=Spirabiliibacterium mucosae TaxID=28156 RepID=UPI001AAD51EE|nr:hypothetical protein [Spirabiliibacterium mucosae]MBE2897782.1 hypothetical protein [Spirabiliibacterium mucosae]